MEKLILALSVIVFSTSSLAGATSVDDEYQLAEIKFKLCEARYEGDGYTLSPTEAYKNYLSCKSEAKKIAESSYKSISKVLKRPSGKAALKEFHASFMTRFESSEAKDGELKSQYISRMAALEEKVENAKQKLTLELPK